MKSKLIIAGGFLGAGKTSLLWETARILRERGERVGLITNDQASQLVDTAFLETESDLVREVSGSCFCCNFNGFADAIRYLDEKTGGGYIIAEPVGSCTDLSATLMQPLKEKLHDRVELRPLSVVADPGRLGEVLKGVPSAGAYIISKQLEEADIILINKTDLLAPDALSALCKAARERWRAAVLPISAKTGEGLAQWLETLDRSDCAGERLADVDYDIYADGEAAFGWLNASFSLEKAGDMQKDASDFLTALSRRFDARNVNVGHVKFLLRGPEGQVMGNITGTGKTAALRTAPPAGDSVFLTVNARAELEPERLKEIVLEETARVFSQRGCTQIELNCLTPGRPNPTYRYGEVIKAEE